jgi:DNA-binding GntR family transcriptional regulator
VTPRLREVRGVSLAEQARESIRRGILDGTLAPDERITIEQIAAELGVSRTPVREALKALESEGLIRLLPHRGAVVQPFAREDLHHRYSIRAMLEGYAAEVACRVDAPGVAAALAENCRRLRAAIEAGPPPGDLWAMVELNQRFHATIHEGSRSATVIRQLALLRNAHAYSLHYWDDEARRMATLEMHEAIAEAFRAGRPARARQLVERHLLGARDLLAAMQEREEEAAARVEVVAP